MAYERSLHFVCNFEATFTYVYPSTNSFFCATEKNMCSTSVHLSSTNGFQIVLQNEVHCIQKLMHTEDDSTIVVHRFILLDNK